MPLQPINLIMKGFRTHISWSRFDQSIPLLPLFHRLQFISHAFLLLLVCLFVRHNFWKKSSKKTFTLQYELFWFLGVRYSYLYWYNLISSSWVFGHFSIISKKVLADSYTLKRCWIRDFRNILKFNYFYKDDLYLFW